MKPLAIARTARRKREGLRFPAPLFTRLARFRWNHSDRKARDKAAKVTQQDARRDRFASKYVIRQANIKFEFAQGSGGRQTGHQHGGEHGGNDEIKQVVSCVERGDADEDRGSTEDHSDSRDVVIEDVADARNGDTTREVGNSRETHDTG